MALPSLNKNLDPHHPGVLPSHINIETFAEFLSRQPAAMIELESLILKLEKGQDDRYCDELKRILHTIKGEAGLLALEDVERLCHSTEDFLGRTGSFESTDLLLSVKDWIDAAFLYYAGKGQPPPDVFNILEKITGVEKQEGTNRYADVNPLEFEEVADQMKASIGRLPMLDMDAELFNRFAAFVHHHIDKIGIQLITLETDPKLREPCDEIYRCFNTIAGAAAFVSAREIEILAWETASLLDQTRKGRMRLDIAIIDLAFEGVDMLKALTAGGAEDLASENRVPDNLNLPNLLARIHLAAKGRHTASGTEPQTHTESKIGELLVATGSTELNSVKKALEKQQASESDKKLGEILIADDHIAPRDVARALREQKELPAQTPGKSYGNTIGVDSDRLDQLVELLGELAIAEIAVSQSAEIADLSSQRLNGFIRELDRVTQEVQQLGLSLRMIPIRPIFQKMERIVRDTGKKTGKKIRCRISGQETELDKTLVDKIGDPLMHIVRNAVDHGIEKSIADRRAAGKNDEGLVEIRAFHHGGSIYLEIEDDGIGIDSRDLRRRAENLGLVASGDTLDETETLDLIFQSGFSTAPTVTEISGRGVGLDVVKRSIESLRGQVSVRSKPDQGSLFTLCIPLTLAIIDGMVVRIGGERFILPTLSVVKTLKIDTRNIISVQTHDRFVNIQGRIVPLVSIKKVVGMDSDDFETDDVLIVVVENGSSWVGLVIDELMGKQQVVIKTLGETMKKIPGISGAAILPDGRIALILDIGGLVRRIGLKKTTIKEV